MKISETIKKLETLMADYGDIDILFEYRDGMSTEFEFCTVVTPALSGTKHRIVMSGVDPRQ